MMAAGVWGGGVVVHFERPIASSAVIKKLVELGYLQPSALALSEGRLID
jgi:hypothetical protein